MTSRLIRTAAVLASFLVGVPAAGAAIAYSGFSPEQQAMLQADVAKGAFPLDRAIDATVVPDDLPEGVVGQAESGSHRVTLDPDVWKLADRPEPSSSCTSSATRSTSRCSATTSASAFMPPPASGRAST